MTLAMRSAAIRPPPTVSRLRAEGTYARFRVGGESYALPVRQLREVARLCGLTPVPGAQPALIGVSNLRGHILPVVDVGLLLSLEPSGQAKHALVVELDEQRIGLAIDEVHDIAELDVATEPHDSDLVSATMTVGGDVAVTGILDLKRLYEVLAAGVAE